MNEVNDKAEEPPPSAPPGQPGTGSADVSAAPEERPEDSDDLIEGSEDRPHEAHEAESGTVTGKRIALVGRLGGMNRREATNLLRSFGASVVEPTTADPDWVVIGAEEPPLAEAELLSDAVRRAAGEGRLEIVPEAELWQRLGLVDAEKSVRQYYTPAMLAQLLGVSVRVIRRWHRLGLITPVRTLYKLPYFDFREVATARRLAQWVASGASPTAIERRLVELLEVFPNLQRPLDQLSVLVEGKQILLRQGDGLIEPGGQLRFDFDSLEGETVRESGLSADSASTVLSLAAARDSDSFPGESLLDAADDEILRAAYDAEDRDDLEGAISLYHAILARDGPRPDISFQLGELLYRTGQPIAARERYYMALELDEEMVEARASLGCVLAETGQAELAVAAFTGVLALCNDYPDVHYNLARILDDMGRHKEAERHWIRFAELAPDSDWAAEARQRLAESVDRSPPESRDESAGSS